MTATFRSLRMQPPLALRKVWWKDQRQRRFAYGRLTFSRSALRFARCSRRAAIRHRTVVGSRFQTSTWHVLEMPDAAQLAETPPSAAGTPKPQPPVAGYLFASLTMNCTVV